MVPAAMCSISSLRSPKTRWRSAPSPPASWGPGENMKPAMTIDRASSTSPKPADPGDVQELAGERLEFGARSTSIALISVAASIQI